MASWMAWATMASLIQLSFPAYKLVGHTIHFPLNFRFLSQFIVTMFAGLTACIIYHPLPPGNHAGMQNIWHVLEYKLFKTIPAL